MKNEETLYILEHIDADLIVQADEVPRKKSLRPYWFAAIAALLVLAIGLPILLGAIGNLSDPTGCGQMGNNPATDPVPSGSTAPTQPESIPATDPSAPTLPATTPTVEQTQPTVVVPLSILLSKPSYPQMVTYPNYDDYSSYKEYDRDYSVWWDDQKQQYDQPYGYANSLTGFFRTSIAQFLQGEGNPTYSPVNVYMAMAMLAETAEGNSRRQILDLFGLDTIEQLRQQASYVWNAHYSNDGQTSLLLANSLWLDNAFSFKQTTADLLAEQYYASSYSGAMGSEEMNQLLQDWLNDNTRGLLQEQVKNERFDANTVFALASTVYFAASWEREFQEQVTKEAIFHSPEGDLTVPIMNDTFWDYYYWGENYTAVALSLSGRNSMWLILPDEGHTVSEILESDEYLQMIQHPSDWEKQEYYDINLSLPKFDVASQQDLTEGIKAMGVTDIFDRTVSDFSSITNTPQLYIGKASHAARVTIDEIGCFGAAYTVLPGLGGAPGQPDKIDFVLDRPFLFVVGSRDCLPLFAGIVNEP